jgi:hypothetical protein
MVEYLVLIPAFQVLEVCITATTGRKVVGIVRPSTSIDRGPVSRLVTPTAPDASDLGKRL